MLRVQLCNFTEGCGIALLYWIYKKKKKRVAFFSISVAAHYRTICSHFTHFLKEAGGKLPHALVLHPLFQGMKIVFL